MRIRSTILKIIILSWRSFSLIVKSVFWGPIRFHPGRTITMLISVVIGVALCVAVDAINSAALKQFQASASMLSAQADFYLESREGKIDSALLQEINSWTEVDKTYPMIKRDWPIRYKEEHHSIRITAFDFSQDDRFDALGDIGSALKLLALPFPFAIPALVSSETLTQFGWKTNSQIQLDTGTEQQSVALVAAIPANGLITDGLLIDIQQARQRLNVGSEIDRLDIRLKNPELAYSVRERITTNWPGLIISDALIDRQRVKAMTRAYRINLGMLSLVALLTAGFLVFSLLSLSFRRRREQLHLLRLLGLSRISLLSNLVVESLLIGVIGSSLGLLLGMVLAQVGVYTLGGDLGAGYFQFDVSTIELQLQKISIYFFLGLGVSVLSSVIPICMIFLETKQPMLRSGSSEDIRWISAKTGLIVAMLLIVLAYYLASQPAFASLPVGGYGAIVACLLSGYLILPTLIQLCLGWVRLTRVSPAMFVAINQLRGAPARAANASGAVLVSFALLVAMTLMVYSFRTTVVAWLDDVLAADYYLFVKGEQPSFRFQPVDLERIRKMPSILKASPILDMDYLYGENAMNHPIKFSTRDFTDTDIRALFIRDKDKAIKFDRWNEVIVSETFSGIYKKGVGDSIQLDIQGHSHSFQIAAIWRDYGYQYGRILMDYERYQELSGTSNFNGIGVLTESHVSSAQLRTLLKQQLPERLYLELVSSAEIKAISIKIFDRTFAITYVLVFIAGVVGLFSVINTLAMQSRERLAEFGMLRHLGMNSFAVANCMALESMLLMAVGVVAGTLLGLGISVILIQVVNAQSFHWTIDTYFPVYQLVLFVVGWVVSSWVAGIIFGWQTARHDPVAAVRSE